MKWLYIIVLLLSLSLYNFYKSCYYQWLDAFNAATTEYNNDLSYCNRQWRATNLCIAEAELAYTIAVNSAGAAYYDCKEQ